MDMLEVSNSRKNNIIAANYIQIFNDPNRSDKLYEDAVESVFHQFPKNNCIKEILIKICILNRLYSTSIYDVYGVASNMLKANVGKYIAEGNEEAVGEIAFCGPKGMYIYSFATKYCSFHEPQKYSMFDSRVCRTLIHYKKKDAFSSFSETDLREYGKYKAVLYDFQNFYGLNLQLRDLDKFMWKHGDDLLQEKKSIKHH